MDIEEFLRSKKLIKKGFSKFIINGDFGSIDLEVLIAEFTEAQQKEIVQLKEENRLYSSILEGTEQGKIVKENKALLGVIEGMKLIIQELENGRDKII